MTSTVEHHAGTTRKIEADDFALIDAGYRVLDFADMRARNIADGWCDCPCAGSLGDHWEEDNQDCPCSAGCGCPCWHLANCSPEHDPDGAGPCSPSCAWACQGTSSRCDRDGCDPFCDDVHP